MVAMEKHEVAVLGAGHAGLRAGINLAKEKKDVLVIEKKTHDEIGEKVCCGGLTSKSIKFVPDHLLKWKCWKLVLNFGANKISHERKNKAKGPMGASIIRHEVGQWQLKRYEEEGGELLPATQAKGLDQKNNELILEDDTRIGYKYLIAADGSTSTITKSMGFKSESAFAGEYRINNYSKEDSPLEVFISPEELGYTYCWIMPYDRGRASVGIGGHPTYSPKQIPERVEEFMLEKKGIDLSKHKFMRAPFRLTYHGFKHNNIFLVGDAASFGSTLWGEGQYQAFVSADIATHAILDHSYKWRDDINDLLKYHKSGLPLLRILPLLPSAVRDALIPKAILKITPKLVGHEFFRDMMRKVL
jgi:flavin-dependent dehydrogenase